jgi:hypothetical protein
MRIVLLLLLATSAVAQPIQCVSEEYRPVGAMVERKPPLMLSPVARPKVKGMRRTTVGDVTIYTREEEERWNQRWLVLFAERGGEWFQLRGERDQLPAISDGGGGIREETAKPPIVTRAKRGQPLVRVTWTSQWMGANRAGVTTTTAILDFRGKPRVRVVLDCSDSGGGGACTSPDTAHATRQEITCDDDLRCTSTAIVWVGWTVRQATRRFDLLTNATIAPSRFDAVTYASGNAFARAVAADRNAIRQRALIDGIGVVQPIYEVSPGRVLFAAHAREPYVAFRFFLLDGERWREIPLTRLTDGGYPGSDEVRDQAGSLPLDHTPTWPQLLFTAYDLELPGSRKLIEVLASENEARSVFWIMLDPNGRTGALRVASDHPEYRSCNNVVYPVSASCLGIPDDGLPAQIQALPSWRMWDLETNHMPRRCELTGRIGWSAARGWIVNLFESPCTDPIARPFRVQIGSDGSLSVRAVKPDS